MSHEDQSDDEYLSADTEMSAAAGTAAAAVLSSIAKTLKEAPINKRYDVDLTIKERDNDEL